MIGDIREYFQKIETIIEQKPLLLRVSKHTSLKWDRRSCSWKWEHAIGPIRLKINPKTGDCAFSSPFCFQN